MAEQYTSIKTVIDKLMRNPLLADLTFEAAIDYTVDFMQIVGVPKMFEDMVEDIPVVAYRAALPLNWIDTISVAYLTPTDDDGPQSEGLPMRYATSTYHQDPNSHAGLAEHTFMIQNSLIVTSFETGNIRLSYRGIAVDNDGFPLLVDNSTFIRALSNYIKLQHYTILFELGKIQGAVYQNVQQQYAWAVGACETDMHRLDLSKAEAFFNMYSTLLIRGNEFNTKFKNSGSKEFLISH